MLKSLLTVTILLVTLGSQAMEPASPGKICPKAPVKPKSEVLDLRTCCIHQIIRNYTDASPEQEAALDTQMGSLNKPLWQAMIFAVDNELQQARSDSQLIEYAAKRKRKLEDELENKENAACLRLFKQKLEERNSKKRKIKRNLNDLFSTMQEEHSSQTTESDNEEFDLDLQEHLASLIKAQIPKSE